MRSPEICLANAKLILPDEVRKGSIVMRGGAIEEIGDGDAVPPGAIDCEGDFVAPGLVELHTDNLERHIQPRPNVDWPQTAAIMAHDAELASVGITTVFDAMRVGSIETGNARYAKYAGALTDRLHTLRNQNALKISHLLHLRAEICSETLVEELDAFPTDIPVGLVSLMDHTPGQRQFRDMKQLKAYVTKSNNLTELEWVEHVARLKAMRARNGEIHERAAVAFAARHGAILASHDDTTTQQVERSAGHGIRLAEFPTTIEAAQACRDREIKVMMGAPNLIRGGSHSGNVSALELAMAGLLDIISSDYVPFALLQSALKLGEIWGDLPRAIACVSRAPALAAGLSDRGQLAPSLRADIIRFASFDGVPAMRGVWSAGNRVA